MGAIRLPRDENNIELIGTTRVRHWASQSRSVEGNKWGRDPSDKSGMRELPREAFQKLPDHDWCIYAKTQIKDPYKVLKDVFYLKDDDEVHIYEILP